MTDQEKREKVIALLERYMDNPSLAGVENYGAKIVDMPAQLIADALTLLKPRVMTLEEYDAWTDIPFTERNPVFHEERTERGIVACWVNTTVCSLREYGKNDRCWTSRPTDEQREATKWDG